MIGISLAIVLSMATVSRSVSLTELQQQPPAAASAASVRGTIRASDADSAPLLGVSVLLDGRLVDVSRANGGYRIAAVPTGSHTISLRRIGFRPRDLQVTVSAGEQRTLDLVFDAQPVPVGLVSVVAASRRPQRLLDAPAAITVVDPQRIAELAPLGQTPLMVADLPGVHVRQSGAFEFNLNPRGFNGTTARRTLVLVDMRDVSVPLLGNQEWSDLTLLDEATRMELVRGPGSALYGANAFGGVLSITTPSVRESQGVRASISGGTPSTQRADVSGAQLSPSGKWGYRGAAGLLQGASWDRSRTDSGALAREYSETGTERPRHPAPGYEFLPLRGQSTGAPLGASVVATGDIDPTMAWYANARVDRYRDNGQTITAEGGIAHTSPLVSTLAGSRSQTLRSQRPWARLAWNDSNFTVFAYYNGRTGDGRSLAAATPSQDRSATIHIEGQHDRAVAGTRGRLTIGASARQISINTDGTILSREGDGSVTSFGALFGQVDYALTPSVRTVLALRGDVGSRDDAQLSPKVGVVWSPRPTHALRGTASLGYLVPPLLARFLESPVAPPVDLRALEAGLRGSPLGPALAGVPVGTLFTNSAAVPALARGNTNLGVERISSYEIGYKGQLSRLFIGLTAYVQQIDGFLSQLVPGGNPIYAPWTAPAAVPEVARGPLEGAVRSAVGRGLTRLQDGSTAFVISGGTAGRAFERGAEAELQWRPHRQWTVDANYSWNAISVNAGSLIVGDTVTGNTPGHSGNLALTWSGDDGTRLRLGVRASEAFDWRSALYVGRVPGMASVDGVLSRGIGRSARVSLAGTNLLDQARYQLFGGSLVRRRVVLSLSWRR